MSGYTIHANDEWRGPSQHYGKHVYDKRGAITAAKISHRAGRVKEARVYSCGDHWHIAKERPVEKKFRD